MSTVYWDASRNRYIGAVGLGFSPTGIRIRKKVSGKTKVEVRDKLRELHKELDVGLRPRRRYTASDALEDWLEHGTDGLSERTLTLYRGTIAKALNEELGAVRLTELTTSDVQARWHLWRRDCRRGPAQRRGAGRSVEGAAGGTAVKVADPGADGGADGRS